MDSNNGEEIRRFREAILHCVEKGDREGAEACLSKLEENGDAYLEHYDIDSLRAFIITFNTMLLVASQRAGVDGNSTDALSTLFNDETVASTTVDELRQCMKAIIPAYCDLVDAHLREKQLKNDSHSPVIRRVLKYIDKNLDDEELKRETICDELNINSDYLTHAFQKQTGMTVTEYIQAERLKYAAELLLSSDKNIGDIGSDCGYYDQNYFSRLFKKYYGKTPREYRNSRGV
ncbi:MAG: AraC family transcriptional regulator [Spirochaetaceae bacterium]|jgi:YesN/AraC family two-component response regulator|nr:AraC family transcriptional regulator [Spirochaetaceae bacterium]